MKNKGPKQIPCETPTSQGYRVELAVLMRTYCFLFLRQELINLDAIFLTPHFSNLNNNIL